jgi:hypothetical protein
LTLRDNRGFDQPIRMAIDVGNELRVSTRAVSELKMAADCGISVMDVTAAVEIMRVKKFRRELFVCLAQRLAAQMADRMEDAEGWHDASRIEPARKQLGGRW